MKILIFTFLWPLICGGNALNILGIFPYHAKSHFIVFRVYLHELAKRGHNLTVISHFPEEEPLENYHDISLAGSMKIFEDEIPVDRSYWTMMNIFKYLLTIGSENCEVMLANKQVQDLVKQKRNFDVIVMEQFNTDCGLGIAYKLGAPVVTIQSSVLMPWHYQRHGIPYNPSFVPCHFLEGGTKPTLYERLERTIVDFSLRFMYKYVVQPKDQNTLTRYFGKIPDLEDLAREIKIILLYQNFVLTGSRLHPANVIEIGGFHVPQAKPLTGDLKKFVDDAEHGIIYISFGSVVKSSSLPKDKLDEVLAALREFPQKVIWKWEDKNLIVDKNKMYLSNWLPQVDILGHPKTIAFYSHAGMGGTTEAIHYGVPMIAMPVLGDQPSNAAAIEESGLGIQLHYRDLTRDTLVAALKTVLDPKFRERAKEVSRAWSDRPASALDTAIFWTEFVARNSNITLRSPAADVPTYQYLNLDIAGILVLIVLSITSPIWIMCIRTKKKDITKNVAQRKNKKSKRE